MSVDMAGFLQWIGGVLSSTGFKTLMAAGFGSFVGAYVVASIDKHRRDEAEKTRRRDAINEVLLGLQERARIVWSMYRGYRDFFLKLNILLAESEYDKSVEMFVRPFGITAYEAAPFELGNLDWFLADDNNNIVHRIGIELHNYHMLLEVNKMRDDLFKAVFLNSGEQHGADLLYALAQLGLLDLEKLMHAKNRQNLAGVRDLKALIMNSFNDGITDDFAIEHARAHLPRIEKFIETVKSNAPQIAWIEYEIVSEQYSYRVLQSMGQDILGDPSALQKEGKPRPQFDDLFDELRDALDSKYDNLMKRPPPELF